MSDETALSYATTFIEACFGHNIGIADQCVKNVAKIAEVTYLQALSMILCAAAMSDFPPQKELMLIEAANYLARKHVKKKQISIMEKLD